MSQKVDITQLCPDCNGDLSWEQVNEPGEEPAYNGRCSCSWEVFDCPKPGRKLDPLEQYVTDRIAELEAANAELLATLANERGEGEAPCEGWEWWRSEQAWALCKDGCGFHVTRTAKGWTWDGDRVSSGQPHFDTARAAMRAASSQGADVPKEQQ